ncbi:MAG: Fe-S cluster assembly protein SufD [Flavobacteriales bacterium]|nr:Fe-S cluster assembly protein SufD [Flavobacteriales bacterium]
MMSAVVEDKKQIFLDNFVAKLTDTNSCVAKKEAVKALENLKFPTTRDEYWKYTRVGKITNTKYSQSPSFEINDVANYSIEGLETYQVVFVNGFFSEELSDIPTDNGVTIFPIAKARKENNEIIGDYFGQLSKHKTQFFSALNTVFNTNGAFVKITKNSIVDKPIHIINITNADSAAFNPRNLFVVEENASVTFINSFETASGSSFTNATTEIYVKEGARVDSYILQNESDTSKQINEIDVVQESNTTYSATTITLNGGLVRNNHNVEVKGQGCETNLFGLYLTSGNQHVDNHTIIDHIEPNCESNEVYIGIVDDNSTAVFNGKVFVRSKAQKTNAYQQNKNMLLTDDASAYSKPELEIYADDVKCSHGSTTGQVDEEAIFYLQTRGVSESNARKMMIRAFANEVLENVKIDALREVLETKIDERFA